MTPSDPTRISEARVAGKAHIDSSSGPDIYSVDPAMGRLHLELFGALDFVSASDDADFCANFTVFVGLVERAFRKEEMWMDDLDHASAAGHQEEHARALGALHHIHSQVLSGNIGVGRYVVDELLPQWLPFHIAAMDTPLARAMKHAGYEEETTLQVS